MFLLPVDGSTSEASSRFPRVGLLVPVVVWSLWESARW